MEHFLKSLLTHMGQVCLSYAMSVLFFTQYKDAISLLRCFTLLTSKISKTFLNDVPADMNSWEDIESPYSLVLSQIHELQWGF